MEALARSSSTHRNPLRGGEFGCASDEDGFYKFHHFFISRSLSIVAKEATALDVVVGAVDEQYPLRTEILDKTISGALRKRFEADVSVREVQRAKPNRMRLHQLADVLLGAVSFRFNRFDRSKSKIGISDTIESIVQKALVDDFRPEERSFKVWSFRVKGDKRWASGARGSAEALLSCGQGAVGADERTKQYAMLGCPIEEAQLLALFSAKVRTGQLHPIFLSLSELQDILLFSAASWPTSPLLPSQFLWRERDGWDPRRVVPSRGWASLRWCSS